MLKTPIALIAALLIAGVTLAFREGGLRRSSKDFLKIYASVRKMSGNELADYVRKSLQHLPGPCVWPATTSRPSRVRDQILAMGKK